MKKILLVFLMFLGSFAFSQQKMNTEPMYVANEEIITMEQVEEYANKGLIKGLHNGVNTETYNELKKRLGNNISEKEFIFLIELYTEAEMKNIKPKSEVTEKKVTAESEYFLNINDKSPDFIVEMIDGQKIQLSNLKGKVVLLNFWATWCAPCIREFYEIPSKILIPNKDQDVVFIPIAIGEDKELVQKKMKYLKEKGIEFNVGVDPNKEIWDQFATGSIPKNIIIDKNGIIKYLSTGNYDKNIENLAAEIKKLLQE